MSRSRNRLLWLKSVTTFLILSEKMRMYYLEFGYYHFISHNILIVFRRSSLHSTSESELLTDFFHCAIAPSGPGLLPYRSITIILRCTTLGRTPMDEGIAHRRDLYLTTHKTHHRQKSMPPMELYPAIPVSERPHNPALDGAATGYLNS
jgi:hypothetical protein